MKSIKSRHKTKFKQKLNISKKKPISKKKVLQKKVLQKKPIINNKNDIAFKQCQSVLKDYNTQIKKLIYKTYKSSVELQQIKDLLQVYYNENEHFKKFCKDNNISSYLLKRETQIYYSMKNYF